MAITDRRQIQSGGPCGPPNPLGVYWGGAALSAVLLAPFAAELAPLLPACLFRDVTGLPCPTCGTAHAVMALARMDLPGAFASNPLAAASALAFVLGGVAAALAALAGWRIREPRLSSPAARAAALLALAANWAWLLLRR